MLRDERANNVSKAKQIKRKDKTTSAMKTHIIQMQSMESHAIYGSTHMVLLFVFSLFNETFRLFCCYCYYYFFLFICRRDACK